MESTEEKQDGWVQYAVNCLIIGGIILGTVYFFFGFNNYNEKQESITKWYEGGTLHAATALDWQDATFDNKLATCGDIIALARREKIFNPDMQTKVESIETIKIISEELVRELDALFKKNPDPDTNNKLYKNQTVASSATIVMAFKGWVK